MKGYIYTLDYSEKGLNESIKIGSTKYPHSRLLTYQTGMFYNLSYNKLYKIISSNFDCYEIDDLIQNHFYYYKTKKITGEGGTEWYETKYINSTHIELFFKDNKIIYEEILLKDCPNNENINDFFNYEYKNIFNKKSNKSEIRDYQNKIINYLLEQLYTKSKIYLELATGAGKTFITFEILSKIKPDIIICFSPRKTINEQNISEKYLEKLNNEYYPINFSKNKDILKEYYEHKKIIITSCVQSNNNLYNIIKHIKCKNIFIWFDEAHWSIEETWLNSEKESTSFWLDNTTNIKYRLFTSASPNPEIVNYNKGIFGELYQPIKVKKLIEQKWLCNINPYIFDTPINDKINLIKYILENFTKFNKTYGLSFHNRTNNAFSLFKIHMKKYINKETNIKPFLYIGDDIEINEKIKKIKINFDFTSINVYKKTPNSIVYSVKKLDMGWDFDKLDFITFSDSKSSSKDIIQSIGRGTRPDKLDNGKNKNKNLTIMLPVFVNDEVNDFTNIINVLKYLIHDIGINIKDSIINKNSIKNSSSTGYNTIDYIGSDEVAAKLLHLLDVHINTKELISILKNNKIINEEQYNIYKNKNKHIKLKKNLYDYDGFKWQDVIDPYKNKYYVKWKDCENAIKYISLDNTIKKKIKKKGLIILNEYDKKIPPFNKIKEYFY